MLCEDEKAMPCLYNEDVNLTCVNQEIMGKAPDFDFCTNCLRLQQALWLQKIYEAILSHV